MNKNSEYWENRVAKKTWNIYNSLEEKNRALLEMYQEASTNISDELYRLGEKMETSSISLSDAHRYNRLSKLQDNINLIIKQLGTDTENFGKKNMYEGFNLNYKATMEELGQIDFAMPNKKLMEEMLNKPWLGSNFSERLWKNTKTLAINLNDILTTGLTQGKTVTEMAIQLNNRMNEGFNVAHRLVRTETMHYLNESSIQAYTDSGCDKVQYWAAEDERTCPRCGIKHGNIYSLKDRPVLPLHANCRCTYLPIIDEEDAKKDHDKAKEDINKTFKDKKEKKEVIISN
ncbi:minor capsid protein [Eubacterium multiforme]|uniref:SPP1 gp7 family putative phage head morphogenesis protein n=1 Tax=Eubacterium multiforme TaxID=83339 RepID=A0ABT9UW87_9FIRM|nr:minor capsid protein [Eubacterium multiforme]MDQ0150574.1 SPP1 gp7 family putative phage head morphogenesis protein [Eubacterium multiforme]